MSHVARGVRLKFFWGGRFPGFSFLKRYFVPVPGILHFSTCWSFFGSSVSLRKRHGLTQLWVPCAGGTGLGHIIIRVWARCVPCAVCRQSKMRCFFLVKCKKAAGPNSLGTALSLRTRVRASASILFSFLFCLCPLYFLLISHSFFFVCFCSNIVPGVYLVRTYSFISSLEPHGWPQLSPSLFQGQV